MQIQRLVANVPGVAPVRTIVQVAGLPVATPAQNIDLGGAQPFGILNLHRAARFRVRTPRTMARLAVDAGLAGLHPKSSGQHDRTCRVASKAAQRRRHRIECAIDPIRRSGVPRRQSERFRRAVITQAVFNQAVFAGLADPCRGLHTRTERPLCAGAGTGIGWPRAPQSTGVAGVRLRLESRRVAVPAHRASYIRRSRVLPDQGRCPNGKGGYYRRSEQDHRQAIDQNRSRSAS